jgi:hypothetical protein
MFFESAQSRNSGEVRIHLHVSAARTLLNGRRFQPSRSHSIREPLLALKTLQHRKS